MLFLPLITRELGLRARRRGSYWIRFAVGGIGLLVCLPELLSASGSAGGNTGGQNGFNTLVGGAFLLCFAPRLLSSHSIGGGGGEGSLGVLFLACGGWL